MFNVDKYKDDMILNILNLCKFKSVSEKSNEIGAPFGKDCKGALDYFLDLGKSLGFKTKNLDGYCGYIEVGSGSEMLGIIGHLDVVPASIDDGWMIDPFDSKVINNKIYGRGTSDDKGPVISNLYALKEVASNINLSKRVRLIVGLNEEKDWECINHYKSCEESPMISYSPDADFPCIYAEKGIVTVGLKTKFNLDDAEILNVSSCNNAINVVPKKCIITLKYKLASKLNGAKLRFGNKKDVKLNVIDDNTLEMTFLGKESHASFPELGENAITKMLLSFKENKTIKYFLDNGVFDIYSPKYLGGDKTKDLSGKLSSNIGDILYENGYLMLLINLRVPVNTSFKEIENDLNILNKNYNNNLEFSMQDFHDPLYVDKNDYLVRTLTDTFNEISNSNAKPIAIGGGTFARAFNNSVSFGMNMPGKEDMCHKVNEYVDIDDLMLSTKIYAEAIYKLVK